MIANPVLDAELIMYAMAVADERGKNPSDDIVTTLIEADVEGEELSDDEFGFFVVMLAVAGNETTRNSITHGMIAFSQNPDQWELFKKDRPETAADEIIRWATPVSAFQPPRRRKLSCRACRSRRASGS
jgi:cholest-4-en-3-one 26-monooxygenase